MFAPSEINLARPSCASQTQKAPRHPRDDAASSMAYLDSRSFFLATSSPPGTQQSFENEAVQDSRSRWDRYPAIKYRLDLKMRFWPVESLGFKLDGFRDSTKLLHLALIETIGLCQRHWVVRQSSGFN